MTKWFRREQKYEARSVWENLADLIVAVKCDLLNEVLPGSPPLEIEAAYLKACKAAAKIGDRKFPRQSAPVPCGDWLYDKFSYAVSIRDRIVEKTFRRLGYIRSPITLPWGVEVKP